jgi:hypothetical protein
MQDPPLPPRAALRDTALCAAVTAGLLARRRLHLPRTRVGHRLSFGDGTTAAVYRDTVLDRPPPREPCVLVVEFRLRGVRGRGHAVFRAESILNTVLFAGYPGFVSKLWFAHDERGVYRGLYEWDDPRLAVRYVRALWWSLALVSHRASIDYRVVPGLRRADVLDRSPAWTAAVHGAGAWWCPVAGP